MRYSRLTRRSASAFAALSTLLLATCDLDKITKPPTENGGPSVSFSITGGNEVILGGTTLLDVTSAADISNTVRRWTSLQPTNATVDSLTGLVTGVQVGPATIRARLLSPELDSGVVQTHQIDVRYKGIRVTAIDSIEGLGLTRLIAARGLNASDEAVGAGLTGVTWTSRDTSIFKVVNQTVVGVKAGQHRLVGELDGMKDSVVVRVRPVAKRIVFPDTHYVADAINANRTVPIRVDDVNDAQIVTPTVTWSVADPTVATIGATTGVIRFLKKDTTRVFATMDSVTRSLKVRVVQLPATMSRTAGDAQTDTVAQMLGTALTVTVRDAGSTPIVGETVTFRVGVGDGAVITDSVRITDANGRATLGTWTLGTNAGLQTVIATAGTATTTFSATAVADVPAQIAFTAPPTSSAIDTRLAPVAVAIQDVYGNSSTAATDVVTLTIANNPGGATLGGNASKAAVNGIATFDSLTFDAAGTGYTLDASVGGLPTVTSAEFNIFGAAAQVGFITQPTSTTAGVVMPQVAVAVQDANGNTVASSTASIGLTLSNNPGASTLGGTVTVSAVNGIATFTTLSLNNAGVGYRLTATALSGPPLTVAESDPFTVAPVGAASKLRFSVEPTDVVAGQAIAPSVRVEVLDANGARVTAGTHNVTLAIVTNPGGASLQGVTTRTTSSGEAVFDNLSLTKVGTDYRLGASVSGTSITPASSGTFDVTAGGATQMAFLAQPSHTVAGQVMSPVRVALLDVNGNLVTTAPSASISLNVTGAGCTAPMAGRGPVNTVNGVATFDQLSSATQMGPCFLQAVATGFSNAQSGTFSIVSSGAPVRLSFTAEPATSTTAGVGMNAGTVSFVNQAGAAATAPSLTNITISVLPGSAGSFNGGTTSQGTTTSTTFNPITFITAGTYRLVANAAGYRPDTSATFTVLPAAANRVSFSVPPTNASAGVPFASVVQVEVRDQYGNRVPAATNVIRIQVFPSGGGPLLRLNNGSDFAEAAAIDGVASFPGLAVYSAGTGHSFQATVPAGGLFGTSTSIDIERAPLSTLGFVTQPASTVGAGAPLNTVEVQAQDSVGNVYTDFTSDITVGLIPGDSATLSGSTVITPVSGVSTFSGLSVDLAGTYRLGASADGLVNGASTEFTVTPAVPTALAFTRQPTNTFINAPLNPNDTVIVEIQDAFGNRVSTATDVVTFALGNNPGGATLSGTLSIAAVEGVVRLGNDVTLNAEASGYTLTASAGGLSGATSTPFDVAAHGAAATLAWVAQPSNTALGAVMGPAVQVAIQDAWGNTVSTGAESGATIDLSTDDLWGMGGSPSQAAVGGIATFSNLVPTSVGTEVNLVAFLGTITSAESDPFIVTGSESLLASTNSDVWDMIVTGSTIVWSETGRIQTLPTAGGSVTQIASPVQSPLGIVTDGTDVYWIERELTVGGTLRKAPLAGGPTVTLVTDIAAPHTHLEVDGSFVYFGDGNALRSVSKSAVGVAALSTTLLYSINPRIGNNNGFELDAANSILYFSMGQALYAGPASGGTPVQLAADSMTTIVLSGSTLYYIDSNGLLKALSTGGGSPSVLAGVAPSGRLASDGVHVYWGHEVQGVWKVPVAGGTIHRLSVLSIWGVDLDGSSVYWARYVETPNGTEIYKSPK